MTFSKSKITSIGRKIRRKLRNGESLNELDYTNLQAYRTSFREDLTPVFKYLSKFVKSQRNDTIIAFRIKRIESILSKIKREPTMALGNMGDIAGCRLIVYSEGTFRKLIKDINKTFVVDDIKDYVKVSKEDGYSGYHIYVKSPINPNKLVEIQIRSIQTHRWASLVEIIDMLYDLKLKEGQSHPDLQLFLRLLARDIRLLNISDKAKIIEIDSTYGVYNKLMAVFLSNHLSIRKDWVELMENVGNNYFIIEVDHDRKSTITSFSDYEQAEAKYFDMFLSSKNSNFVLTFVDKPNYRRICTAYASYILTRHNYMEDWVSYMRDIISEDIKKGTRKRFDDLGEFLKRNLKDRVAILNSEIMYISEELDEMSGDKPVPRGISEWNNDLSLRIKEIDELVVEVNGFVKKLEPNAWTKFVDKFK